MRIRYVLSGSRTMRAADAAYITKDTDDLAEEVAEAIIQAISTDVELSLGDKTVHLAMLLDPPHWDDDWRERGVDDVDAFLASLIEK